MKLINLLCFILLYSSIAIAQTQEIYSALTVKDTLKKSANSVIRNEKTEVTVEAVDKMTIKLSRIITVFNNSGLKQVGAYVHYDDATKIKDLDFYVYNLVGEEVEHYKKRDFKDQSAVSNGTLYSDNRVYYLDYKPKSYPVTVKFEYKLETENTAFIRPFFPLDRYFQSVEKSTYKIENKTPIKLRYQTQNFERFSIQQISDFHFVATDMPAIESEEYSPSFQSFVPSVKFGLNEFNLEGVRGEATNWKEFGIWQYNNFLKGYDQLPKQLETQIKNLVADATTTKEKAKLIYNFMQDNSRYISVQLGIGGWRPMPAEDVFDKKYGDCKALTNYTMALLKSVGIESNYCVVYSGSNQRDIDPDFFSMQGNHVILQVEDQDEDYWLECTSQTKPFNFLGTFTDNRKVLAISETGGQIVQTPAYLNDYNLQNSTAKISFDGLDMYAEIKINSYGTQYDRKAGLERIEDRIVERYYKNYWGNLNRLSLKNYNFINNKDKVIFTEDVKLKATKYLKKFGNDVILEVNPFNQKSFSARDYENRSNPFEIERGYKDVDEYVYDLGNYKVSDLPDHISIKTKFGKYELKLQLTDNNTLIVNRNVEINKNKFEKTDYKEFQEFLDDISRSDQTKIILN
ncbi:DUF3857 domain-containing protein [Psychroflexus sp. ALD_RP9]|uniref:DUF3857 domain-containing protein n=1 Tax=Psychroflexus sp. ALD_RP9 TaxID=2777186 RepID=UPI001A8D75F2|nr:DUF3857 domain-containing protein [Psychroflexus sp. ALD_RP9]QSS97129.1 DUF3857 domain-containing protein [Psychroflexus sp. ALD_RP9]